MKAENPMLEVRTEGSGPEVLFVHGGAGPADHLGRGRGAGGSAGRCASPIRRGYGASPEPVGGRQDFDVDAADLAPLLARRPHLVAHSYGCHARLHRATRRPELGPLADADRAAALLPQPRRRRRRAAALARRRDAHDGENTEPGRLREFLRISGVEVDDGPLPEAVLAGVRRAQGDRLASEARPDLAAIRAAGIPALVASGDHRPRSSGSATSSPRRWPPSACTPPEPATSSPGRRVSWARSRTSSKRLSRRPPRARRGERC